MASPRSELKAESIQDAPKAVIPRFSRNHEEGELLYRHFYNHPLVGVYNVITQQVSLMPCMKELVYLYTQDSIVESGYKLNEESRKIRLLTKAELDTCKQSSYAPRFMEDEMEKSISSHEYHLCLLGDIDNREDYRGFAV